jgi:hypothetical protein
MMQNQPRSAYRQSHHSKWWLYSAAILSVVAGLIHLVVAPEHFEEWLGYGLFFAVATVAQLMYALLLVAWKPTRNLLLAGIIGNSLIIGLYLVTRTLGIPFFGPHAGDVEPIGMLDTISKIVELALIVCLVVMWRVRPAAIHGGHPNSGAGLLLM